MLLQKNKNIYKKDKTNKNNKFTIHRVQELREAIKEAETSSKTFNSVKELADEIFQDTQD